MEKRYEFNAKKHIHTLDGKPLTGVTTVLSVIAKPALISWAANTAVDYINEHRLVGGENTVIVPVNVLNEARKAHINIKNKAGDWGTKLHKWVENYIQSQIMGVDMPDEKETMASNHFIQWAIGNKVKFLESEKNLFSEKLWLGGIVDIVCEIDGKKWIADVKTSSAIYPENFAQMAAYQLMLEEMGLYSGIVGHIVINIRKDGTFEEKRSVSTEEAKEFFLACLKIYRIKEKINNQII